MAGNRDAACDFLVKVQHLPSGLTGLPGYGVPGQMPVAADGHCYLPVLLVCAELAPGGPGTRGASGGKIPATLTASCPAPARLTTAARSAGLLRAKAGVTASAAPAIVPARQSGPGPGSELDARSPRQVIGACLSPRPAAQPGRTLPSAGHGSRTAGNPDSHAAAGLPAGPALHAGSWSTPACLDPVEGVPGRLPLDVPAQAGRGGHDVEDGADDR
jgi:hypothetical protein